MGGGGGGNGPEGRKEKKMSHVARRKKGKGGIPLNVMSLDATWVSSLEVHRREGFDKH